MKITNINPGWGSIVEIAKEELLECHPDDIKQLGYSRDLILFRGLGLLSYQELYKIMTYFGNPWTYEEYTHSREYPIKFDYNGNIACITKFSNVISKKLVNVKMPWHVDIPNWGSKSFPWRSLYNLKNPNPTGGITSWVNMRLELITPTEEELAYYNTITVLNQSWQQQSDEFLTMHPYIKKHIVTGVESLRSNYFVSDGWSPHAWIKQVFVNNKSADNLEILGKIHKKISSIPDLVYDHTWKQYDLIVYDNWNLMHKRTQLDLTDGEERLFCRTNIHHVINKVGDNNVAHNYLF